MVEPAAAEKRRRPGHVGLHEVEPATLNDDENGYGKNPDLALLETTRRRGGYDSQVERAVKVPLKVRAACPAALYRIGGDRKTSKIRFRRGRIVHQTLPTGDGQPPRPYLTWPAKHWFSSGKQSAGPRLSLRSGDFLRSAVPTVGHAFAEIATHPPREYTSVRLQPLAGERGRTVGRVNLCQGLLAALKANRIDCHRQAHVVRHV